ncbi:MAG: hypothetical protein P4L46_07985 [Fimbriimonas sp.]|nr:hypothetical protein [Fimbriimonas sp.]
MYVPNYIPEPVEVPGNITEEKYPLRIAFVRKVALYYLASVCGTAALSFLGFPHAGIGLPVVAVAICLFGLDLLRIAIRGKPSEARVSVLCLPPALILSAWVIREIRLEGMPTSEYVVGAVSIVLYTYLSGRDFSFVGCCLLSLIASSAVVAGMSSASNLDRWHASFALGTNALFVFYVVYDLASLMARRRRGEELAAVVDLYRDVFNFFGYAVRIVKHWRKHRIWTNR